MPRWATHIVIASLIGAAGVNGAVGACGRIGFDSAGRGAADAVSDDVPAVPIDGSIGGPVDGAFDGNSDAGLCEYLSSCMTGQITCCTATGSFCFIEGTAACPGTIARCSIFTQQGCAPGWACCITTQRPEASCYDPLFPQPC